MAYNGRILTRSPYFITVTATATATMVSATLGLYIWEGLEADRPATATYVIEKLPLKSTDEDITFEISELIRDYFDHDYDPYNNATTDVLWVSTEIDFVDTLGIWRPGFDEYLGLNGYGYFEGGVNPSYDYPYDEILVPEGEPIYIPVQVGVDGADSIEFWETGHLLATQTLTETTSSETKLMYVTQLRDVFNVDEIRIMDGVSILKTIIVTNVEDCKFGAKKVAFINKNGENQVVYFTAKDQYSLSTSKDSYKSNIGQLVSGSYFYDVHKHQQKDYNITGNESANLNTGWMPESQNAIFKQLLLSEYVWLDDKPVSITSNGMQYQTLRDDRLINYTFTFDYSNNVINNVY